MKKITFNLILLCLCVLSMVATTHALEVQTHQAINAYIAQNTMNGFLLGAYLQSQLGFEKGTDETFNSLAVWEWLRDGGLYEDIPHWYMPYVRSFNHFHNPINKQGYGTFNSAIQQSYGVKSTIIWGQILPVDIQSPYCYG